MKALEDDDLIFFEESVKENYKMMRSYYRAMNLSPESAEDLVQEAFMMAFKLLSRFDRSKPIRPWLRGIAKNKYLEFCREKKEIPLGSDIIEIIDAQYHYWEDAHIDDCNLYEFLKKCIAKLDAEAAKAVELFYYKKLSTQEMANVCELNETTVRKRLQRVRENLKNCMSHHLSAQTA